MLVMTTLRMPASGKHYTRLPMMAHADVPVCAGGGLALPAVLTLDNWPQIASCPLLSLCSQCHKEKPAGSDNGHYGAHGKVEGSGNLRLSLLGG
jgi:hypothetical protein